MVRCSVKGCNSDSIKRPVRFHSFPSNKKVFTEWISKTNLHRLQDKITPYNYFKVCREHFTSTDYISDKHLKKGAVPSLNLPKPPFNDENDDSLDDRAEVRMEEESFEQINQQLQDSSSLLMNDHILDNVINLNHGSDYTESIVPTLNINNTSFLEDHNYCLDNVINMNNDHNYCLIWSTGISKQMNPFEDHNLSEPLEEQFQDSLSILRSDQMFDSVLSLNQLYISSKNTDSLKSFRIPSIQENEDLLLSNVPFAEKFEEVCTSTQEKRKRPYNSAARKQRYYASKVNSMKLKVKSLQKKKNNPMWQNLKKNMTKAQINFIEMQMRNSGRHRNGIRYSLEEKSMCLALCKKSPMLYRDLSSIVRLPTRETLKKHASIIHFEPGINANMMNFIKEAASKMTEKEKMCCLAWDEVSLDPELDYCKSKDCINGFVDVGKDRGKDFTNHALTFMIRGIEKPFKQSIAFFFTKPDTKGHEVAEFVRLVIEAVLEAGLIIVLSVCDQIAVNITAINCLISLGHSVKQKSNGQLIQYMIKNAMITHIYDGPHLLKGVRNNLLTKNLHHFVLANNSVSKNLASRNKRSASWNDVKKLYKHYTKSSSQLLSKINDEHICPKKLKMKTSLAAQIFSNTFGNTMNNYSRENHKNDFTGTADILIFFNDVFDSINGSGDPIGNSLKCSISRNSGHVSYWKSAISEIEKMEWVIREEDEDEKAEREKKEKAEIERKKKAGKNVQKREKKRKVGSICRRSKVLFNFISTLKGLIFITDKLLNDGFEHFSPKRCNSDGLENYFGQAKRVSLAARSPSPRQFQSAFTTLFLDNNSSFHSPRSNCEKDDDVPLLQSTLLFFKVNGVRTNNSNSVEKEDEEDTDDENEEKLVSPAFNKCFMTAYPEDESLSYTAGRLCKKLRAKTKCQTCLATLEVSQTCAGGRSFVNSTIQNITFNLPSLRLLSIIKSTVTKVEEILPSICFEKNLSTKLLGLIGNDFGIGCDLHKKELTLVLYSTLVDLLIYAYTRRVNSILKGKLHTIDENDDVQKAALAFRRCKKHIGKYGTQAD